jgi:hypothetical protein
MANTYTVQVVDGAGAGRPIANAQVTVYRPGADGGAAKTFGPTNADGLMIFTWSGEGDYQVGATAFGLNSQKVDLDPTNNQPLQLKVPVGFQLGVGPTLTELANHADGTEGGALIACLSWKKPRQTIAGDSNATTMLHPTGAAVHGEPHHEDTKQEYRRVYQVDLRATHGMVKFEATLIAGPTLGTVGTVDTRAPAATITDEATALIQPDSQSITGDVSVAMRRTATDVTEDLSLWVVIRKSTEALSFNNYFRYMNFVLCGEPIGGEHHDFESNRLRERFERLSKERFLPFTDSEAYRLLKVATEAFVMVNCGVALRNFHFDRHDIDLVARRVGTPVQLSGLWHKYLHAVNGTPNATLPYLALIRDKMRDVPLKSSMFSHAANDLSENCFGILRDKLTHPCLTELIWSYWHEEGMLVQSVNAIARRFQNVRGHGHHDPLANLEIDPLRPLNNLFWGFIQDEQHRLSVVRRNYEYDHEYGLRLEGRAVSHVRTADSRSKFIEAFHGLLNLCGSFYKQDDDTTVIADGFPVLNALKEVHLILSQGAHNQYGEAPSTSRIEMMMQQWMLGRPEFREFLPTRIMVAYPEPWMDRVDAMKKIQGWTDTSVLHFRNLGVFGEQVLLSIRYGAWSTLNDPVHGTNWARFWRPEIQGYIHAYRSVTGVDLTAANVAGGVDTTLPSVLLRRRLAQQAAAG